MEDKITTIRLKKSVKDKLMKLKKYPRETDEQTLIRMIKNEVNKKWILEKVF